MSRGQEAGLLALVAKSPRSPGAGIPTEDPFQRWKR